MVNVGYLKKKVEALHTEAHEIQKIGIAVLNKVKLDGTYLLRPDYKSGIGAIQRDGVQRYQRWYSTSFRLVEEFLPEWADAFEHHYKSTSRGYGSNAALDLLMLNTGTNRTSKSEVIADFINHLDMQISILTSIPDAVEVKELNLRKLISADVARTEIEQAEILLTAGFHRAAGSIAGVALELHLKTLCDINAIVYSPKATIEPFAQALYDAKILDITEFKRIQYFGSIRNKCSHPNDISEKEVQALLDGVKKLV
jgi:hypothetical protein